MLKSVIYCRGNSTQEEFPSSQESYTTALHHVCPHIYFKNINFFNQNLHISPTMLSLSWERLSRSREIFPVALPYKLHVSMDQENFPNSVSPAGACQQAFGQRECTSTVFGLCLHVYMVLKSHRCGVWFSKSRWYFH